MSIKCHVESCVYNNRADKCVLKYITIGEDGKCGACLTTDYLSLAPLNHLYHFGKDGVYCRIWHEVINDVSGCSDCSLLAGSLQGEGIECLWDDVFGDGFMHFHDPKRELLRVSNLIEMGIFSRYPTIKGEHCHQYTVYNEKFKRKVSEDRARPRIYTKEQMIIWPDDADSEEVAAFFDGKLEL